MISKDDVFFCARENSGLITVNGINSEAVKKLERELSANITVESLNLEEIFLELNQ